MKAAFNLKYEQVVTDGAFEVIAVLGSEIAKW